jgi:hypothetical protein
MGNGRHAAWNDVEKHHRSMASHIVAATLCLPTHAKDSTKLDFEAGRRAGGKQGEYIMRSLGVLAFALAVGACNQTAQVAAPQTALASASSAPVEPAAPVEAAPAQPEPAVAASLPPIYEPLVDMHRVNRGRYERDLAACREQAAPQERAARAATERQAAGTAVATMGAIASFIPVQTFGAARALDAATGAAQGVGASAATEGAVTAANATADYALVVNTCLQHRGYRLLRA